MSDLRQKMTADLELRNYSPCTIRAYIRCVASFAKYFHRSPDQLGPAHVREYQLFLVQQKKASWALFNQTVCALRFFYHVTLGRKEMIEHIPYPRPEKRLPTVLSQAEVTALLQATNNLKHRAILTRGMATIRVRILHFSNLRDFTVNVADTAIALNHYNPLSNSPSKQFCGELPIAYYSRHCISASKKFCLRKGIE